MPDPSPVPASIDARAVDALARDRALLAELVAFDSRSSASDVAVADRVADRLEAAGCRVERQAWADPDTGVAKVNLFARRGPDPAPARRGLLLSGHLDVVPADEADWETDPFALVERGGMLHGRGACDMKGFDAIATNVLAETPDDALVEPLCLLLTADEEVGSLGARRFAEEAPAAADLPRMVLVGEPTGLEVVRMHKGHLKARIDVVGAPAHSGTPHLGRNAIEPLAALLPALVAWKDELAALRTDASAAFPDVPGAVMNLARIDAGGAVNVVPEHAAVFVGIRLLPGMASGPALERLASIAAAAGGVVTVLNDSPPMRCPADAPIRRAVAAATGDDEVGRGVPFSSDAGVLSALLGLDCVLCGPGFMRTAHRANEHVPIDHLVRARAMVEALVRATCLRPGSTA